MARVLQNPISHFLTTSILFFFLTIPSIQSNYGFVKVVSENKIKLKKEKLSHLRFFWHDIFTGKNPSAATVVQAPSNTSRTSFGRIVVIDDPLTEGPQLSSKIIGRAQGLYTLASQQVVSLLMAMNFAFIEGKYKGSTITVLGRNPVRDKVREMPVIGGSGLFRFASGYVQAKTYKFNMTSGDATVEYNVCVLHY
ncbi:dirigent protein 22-like [Cornus florida]|uniref:dirigent protein 22-like n=1 Tax=Cornus florida TaxID=4283 RepID=UPI0028A18333|nr:dirigent protein 22-like [Cornus florida]